MVQRLARPKKMGLSRPVVLINLYGDIFPLDFLLVVIACQCERKWLCQDQWLLCSERRANECAWAWKYGPLS
jgi:hypothetical protein